ncbi:MAG: radical SAM protein [Thermoplasmata archaeon]|nr:radical SAM protein [Thermoplasmata archaeon]
MEAILQSFADTHPCYSSKAHYKIARIHLPVAPKCNISCNYCDRKVRECYHGTRPGWTAKVSSPQEALESLEMVMDSHPNLEVAGVAGPGEPLYNAETFTTLKLIDRNYPELKKCVCTNGLLLPEKIHQLKSLDVDFITVTINAVTPETGAKINKFVVHNGKKYYGLKAAKILIANQLIGLELATQLGFLVKVNTVLIPELNMKEMEALATAIKHCGTHIMNIMPLIPAGNFQAYHATTCEDLNRARGICEEVIPQFRLCKQCRADACGVPGLE